MTSHSNIIVGYKGKMIVDDSAAFYAPYVPLDEGNMKINIRHEQGHPEGYTDDLGIIADRDQWVRERLRGWYAWIHHSQFREVHAWCEANIHGHWLLDPGIIQRQRELYMSDSKDVTLFSLRWS